jgi:anaphase-promoting complex subunit 10
MANNLALHFKTNDNLNQLKPQQSEKHEIGEWAVWSLSSAKTGFGIQQLRDDDFNTYWQSDGDQPHFINIQFHKKMTIQEVAIQVSFKLDETYTPSEISIRSGTTFNDLMEIKKFVLNKSEGWVYIQLSDEEECLRTNFLQIVILSMHLGGRDTHVRQVKVFGPRNPVSSVLKIPFFESVDFTMYNTIR